MRQTIAARAKKTMASGEAMPAAEFGAEVLVPVLPVELPVLDGELVVDPELVAVDMWVAVELRVAVVAVTEEVKLPATEVSIEEAVDDREDKPEVEDDTLAVAEPPVRVNWGL